MIKKILIGGTVLVITGMILLFSINCYVIISTKRQIRTEDYSSLKDIDCILVLGAGVWGDVPSPMLEDRLIAAIDIYNSGVAPKIIMSGDHGRDDYDEVNVMKRYAVSRGVPSEDIFMDHAGFSTYDSIYRAKEIFEVDKIIIVTQEYHLYRALYIANVLGVEAYGVSANPRRYSGQLYRDIREMFARNKDFIKVIFKPRPTYLGETIPVIGNGDVTND